MENLHNDDLAEASAATESAASLTPEESRVLAALYEKSITTPKYYPMTTNSIMLAANQKNSRNPVMALSEGEVGHALNVLEQAGLVKRDDSSARAIKWRQRLRIAWGLEQDEAAVLVASMLRGALTRTELKTYGEPLGGAADLDAVDHAMQMLQLGSESKIVPLEKATGQKEGRFMHTMCGADYVESVQTQLGSALPPKRAAASAEYEQRIALLEDRVAKLEQALGLETA